MQNNLTIDKQKYFIGDSCLAWSLGKTIDNALSNLVLRIFRIVKQKQESGELNILDVVPSYNAIAVYFDPVLIDLVKLEQAIDLLVEEQLINENPDDSTAKGTVHRLPTVYNGEDLPLVAEKNKLTIEQVITLHTAPHYKVAMVGFLPHFPYLIGLDPRLETPRLDNPRTKIPKGAVAIGGAQTGVYPRESPGGWNIIGMTDPKLLEAVNPGDIIIFERVEQS